MIKPTVGRVVWFHPGLSYATQRNIAFGVTDQPLAATIAHVINDNMVNLSYLDQNGNQYSATSVPFKHDEDSVVYGEFYCEWMPYQKEQALLSEVSSNPDSTKPAFYENDDERVKHVYYVNPLAQFEGAIGGLEPLGYKALSSITYCILVLHDGSTVTGMYVTHDPDTYGEMDRAKYAYQEAIEKLNRASDCTNTTVNCAESLAQGVCGESSSSWRDERLSNRENAYMLTQIINTPTASKDLRTKAENKLSQLIDKLN